MKTFLLKRSLFLNPILISILFILYLFSCNLSHKSKDHPVYFNPVFDTVDHLVSSGHSKTAFTRLDSFYAVFPDPGFYDIYRKYFWKMNVSIEMNDFIQAHSYADSILLVLNSHQDECKIEYAEALFAKGKILVQLNEFNKAFESFYEGKEFIEQKGDSCAFAKYNRSLASIRYIQGKYVDAIKYMKQAYLVSANCDSNDYVASFLERQGGLDNIGLSFDRLHQYDSAVVYYLAALDFINKNEYRFPGDAKSIIACRAVVNGNLGNAYMQLGNFAVAEKLFAENIAANLKLGYENMDAQLTEIKLARLYIKEGKFKEVQPLMKHIRDLLDVNPNVEEELAWRKANWTYYDTVGDIPKAYYFHKLYVIMTDSLETARRELPGADFNKTFDHLKQEGQIADLKKTNRFKDVSLFVSILICVMASIIMYLVLKHNKQSKLNLERQTKLNEQISNQNITLQKTLNALEHSQQENTRMMRVVAHDLHNPIAAMVSLIDLLRDGKYDDEQLEMFDMLATSGDNALKLINSMLHAKPTMAFEPLAFDELVTYSVGLMQYRANEKKQTLQLEVTPIIVLADREKLWRVINNLIVNAIKFSYEGKDISIKLMKKGNKAILSVKDEGVGISSEMKGEIFHLFANEGKKGTSGEESFGLGLSIARQIIEAHGGRIWFISEKGKGTTFYVELNLYYPGVTVANNK